MTRKSKYSIDLDSVFRDDHQPNLILCVSFVKLVSFSVLISSIL